MRLGWADVIEELLANRQEYREVASDPAFRTEPKEKPVQLGVQSLKPEALARELDGVIKFANDLIRQLDSQCKGERRMLARTGLMDHVCQLRTYLMSMKHNMIRKVVQKALHKVELQPGERMKVKVRVLDKEYSVELRADYEPATSAEATLEDY